ncbi:MAG: matrixin family metalloprotease, partial [Nitrososphaerales archaeon]
MSAKHYLLLATLLISPLPVYGYAESVGALNAKWNQQNVTVCIVNNAENFYEDLFIDAVNAWSDIWSHLKYKFGDIEEDSCKITVYIVRAHADMTSSGHAGVTQTSFVPGGGIVSSSILIPTEIEHQDGSIYRITETIFYRIAMHEFGHAIGLTHANNENYLEPIDV